MCIRDRKNKNAEKHGAYSTVKFTDLAPEQRAQVESFCERPLKGRLNEQLKDMLAQKVVLLERAQIYAPLVENGEVIALMIPDKKSVFNNGDKEFTTITSVSQFHRWIKIIEKIEDINKSINKVLQSMSAQQRDEQLSKETELKEEEVQLNADLSKINKQMDELKAKLNDFGVSSVQEIQAKMESMEASNKKLQEDIDQIKSATEVAAKKRAEQATELAGRQKEQAEYRAALAKNGDEYPVLSVDPQWGFVVIGAGQGSNIDPNTVLLVTRDGRSIGKLKVTSLEKNQTVADIVKDSVPAGMSIQPGDMVQLLRPLQSAK